MSGIVVSAEGPSVGGRAVRATREWGPALVVLALVLGTWEGAIVAFHVQQFLLPKPSDIASSFWIERHTLWPAGWYTFKEALGGFVIGSALGVVAATVVGRFKTVGTALMPIFIAASSLAPMIASRSSVGARFAGPPRRK